MNAIFSLAGRFEKVYPRFSKTAGSPYENTVHLKTPLADNYIEEASNESGVVENGDFRFFARYIFRTFTSKVTFIILLM